MKYAWNKTFPLKATKLKISSDIARKAIKRIPSDQAGKDLKRRLSDYGYFYGVVFHNEDVWLSVSAAWATHYYLLRKAEGQRLRELADLLDSW